MPNEKQLNIVSSTPFDDVFRTECEKMKELMIPLISELFGKEYDVSVVNVLREANEHLNVMNISNEIAVDRRITDSCLRIGNKLYHIECQSTEDGSILMRLVEYNMQIAYENASYEEKDRLVVEFPYSALIKLRSGYPGKDKLSNSTIEYRHDGQSITMKIPILNVGAYSEEDFFDKGLFVLMPFYTIRYEDMLNRIAAGVSEKGEIPLDLQKEYDKICLEIQKFSERITKAYETDGLLDEEKVRDLLTMSKLLLSHISRKMEDRLKERLVKTMGGNILELPSDVIRREKAQAKAMGEAIGEEKGINDSVAKLADHYLREHPEWTREEAVRIAESILR